MHSILAMDLPADDARMLEVVRVGDAINAAMVGELARLEPAWGEPQTLSIVLNAVGLIVRALRETCAETIPGGEHNADAVILMQSGMGHPPVLVTSAEAGH